MLRICRICITTLALSAMVFLLSGWSQRGAINVEEKDTLPSSKAFRMAVAYTGFGDTVATPKAGDAELTAMEDTTTPFMWEKLHEHKVWKIILRNIEIGRGGHKGTRDFEIFLDSASNQLLCILSVDANAGSADTLPALGGSAAAEYMQSRGFRINGLPDGPPPVSFAQALSACIKNPARSRVIRGILVDCSVNGARDSLVWIVVLHGTDTPLLASNRAESIVPENQRNSVWNAVDATTGKLKYVTNAPLKAINVKE